MRSGLPPRFVRPTTTGWVRPRDGRDVGAAAATQRPSPSARRRSPVEAGAARDGGARRRRSGLLRFSCEWHLRVGGTSAGPRRGRRKGDADLLVMCTPLGARGRGPRRGPLTPPPPSCVRPVTISLSRESQNCWRKTPFPWSPHHLPLVLQPRISPGSPPPQNLPRQLFFAAAVRRFFACRGFYCFICVYCACYCCELNCLAVFGPVFAGVRGPFSVATRCRATVRGLRAARRARRAPMTQLFKVAPTSNC